jgi:hypothetical protein
MKITGNKAGQKGGVPGNRPASSRKVPQPDGRAIIRSAGADVTKRYNATHKPKPPQKISDPQNWRRG